ncbi:MAG TPA: PAS domain S-box protein, partial [Nitrospirae bacterium]|nr:PAS domain S-box protein [Nitrospirota bacterium]
YDKKDDDGNVISFDFDDLTTAEGFANITSVAIEKILIFERERTRERAALEEKKRMDILFESVRGGIVTLDREWKILLANRFVENWTDKKVEDMIGKNSIEVFHMEEHPICPHCVAKATFETGEINTITLSRGINYAELTSYPIKDDQGNVVESVVFIQDITDRVLYQEEILSLYREVSQNKEYLESLIDNSADAIITSDLDGIVTSWNKGAEKIYGFTEEEAINTFLPFLPDFLIETEKSYMERIKEGETIKDIETVRLRKDGTMFEVSLTLSPIKDTSGEVIAISGISRDISEKKKVEKELIRRNQELSRLFFISSAMRGTLELNKLLRMVLTAVTMSDGLGFNRSILFMIDEEKNVVRGVMGVGPADSEEAWQIWDRLSINKKTLLDLLKEVEDGPLKKDSFLDKLSVGMEIPLDQDTTITRSIKEKTAINVIDVHQEPLSDNILIQQTGTQAYALIPLVSRDRVLGVLWVDNYFNRKPITDEDIRFLSGFSDQVAAAVESARLFEQVKLTEAELENIFESISDMVYFNSSDYEIKNINRAVAEKIGKPPEEIIGQKCYKVFHNMDEPWDQCPHHKTVETKKAYVEEIEDPNLGGTFLVSSSPIFNPQNDFIGTVHVVRDITELKKLREKLSTADRMAALGEVAAKVAHEIRNPLVSIGGFSRRLEKKLNGSLKDYASVITNEVTRLEGILKEILGYVREIRLIKETTTINSIINEILPLFQEEVRKKRIDLVLSFDENINNIEVDVNRIKEAFINLIRNSFDAVSENGEIKITTHSEGNFVVTEISDTGHGVDKKDMPYLFDPFFTTKITGTGLGLSITHRIIEQHNGKIEVTSEPGKGATFKIYIPVKEV